MAATKSVNVTLRMDERLKKEVDVLFDDLGLDFNTAVKLFCRQALLYNGIPFPIVSRAESPFEGGVE